jgi:membrane protease YdiL (CAAX protease family)
MPLQTLLQNNIGDFVPAGETLKALGTQNLIFFIANVVLAPFVEESIYRNYVLTRFLEKYSKRKSIILSALFFGLLHWTGGVWYMLMTALFVGVPFALIVVQKKNILWVYTAHLTLNFLEFNYIFFS